MMYIRGAREHFTTWRGHVPVCWLTVAVFAIVIAYSDGFWVTSLEGTVGAIERSGTPLHRWLLDSTLMLPLFFLAVVTAVLMARRLVGGSRSALVKFATTALLVAVLGTVVAVAEMGASAAYDYHLQTRHLQVEQQLHHTHPAAQAGVVTPTPTGSCIGLCASVRDTFNVHMRSLLLGSGVLLLTNLVLAVWVVALRSDRLWRRPVRNPLTTPAVVSQELSLV